MKYWFIAAIIIASIALYAIAMPKIEAGEVRSMKEKRETVYLAGGCFWGVEGYFAAVEGVLETEVGYANGKSDKATYEGLKESDHAETVRIVYDAHRVTQEEILLRFFDIIDPTSVNKQGNDVGRQYRTGIYYKDAEVGKTAKAFVESQKKKYTKAIAVEVELLKHFVPAEKYHQKYLAKNPGGYCHVNLNDAKKDIFEKKKFEKSSDLKEKIGELAYRVTQENATEKPFTSDLLAENRPGIYVDIVSGEALFLSSDKFDAGCGWPSFSKALTTKSVKYLSDTSHGMQRIEVRSSHGDSHLGHVFNDGPKDKGGLRYCINGAALRFIPKENMEKEGYGEYLIFLKP